MKYFPKCDAVAKLRSAHSIDSFGPMYASRNIWILGIGLVVLGAGLWWVMKPDPSVETLIQEAASRQLDRPVGLKIDFKNEVEDWIFICGSVTEADGAALKIETNNVEAAYESDAFCALANSQELTQLSEFDFGSTDMPAMDWLERYDLNPDILTSGER